jgi:ABC-2 type transport system ATP-binding protein
MTHAIDIRGLEKSFPNVKALAGVDLTVEQGEFFALLGPNGAGKTTLISILAGLTRADKGTASVMGFDVVSQFAESRSRLGVVPQELVFDPFFSVRETLRLSAGYYGVAKPDAWIDELLDSLDLTKKANANMRSLSGGMKRRVLVAQALVHKPPVIVLDEPTAGVDVELRQSLWAFVKKLNEQGHTIILTTHYLEEAEALCNRVAMLKAGQVVALDSTANLLRGVGGIKVWLKAARLPDAYVGKQINADTAKPGEFSLSLANYAELEALLNRARTAEIAIEDMRLEAADLEQAFLKIMAKN